MCGEVGEGVYMFVCVLKFNEQGAQENKEQNRRNWNTCCLANKRNERERTDDLSFAEWAGRPIRMRRNG